MANLNDTDRDLHFFRWRLAVLVGLVLICFFVLFVRFFWLQVVRHDKFASQAEENRISIVPIVPNRGLIMDRNGVLLARNYSAYTLEITPSKIRGKLDDVINELAEIVTIKSRDRKRFKKLYEESKRFESILIRSRLTDEEVARFIVQRYRFPGVDIQARLFRQYPMGSAASHVIGYIGRMSQKDIENLTEEDEANYRGTNYIGKEGVEKSHERELHGITGYEEMEVSAGGRAIRTLSHSAPVPGNNLYLSIDIELQKVVEEAFGNRRGALVAIQPETGEVLAYVSTPTYDPNLFVEGIDQQSWDELNNSPDHPLINRPLRGAYPPGSTYKPFMALAALELGKRTPESAISDPGYFYFGNHRFRDDKVGGHGIVDMYKSIVHSCDTYYYILANDMGVNMMHDFMKKFGFGQLTGIDLAHERKGLLPSTEWKRTAFKTPEQQKWYAGETISLGIGQGYNSFTPMQLAYATAMLANGGKTRKPHLVHALENSVTREKVAVVAESREVALKPENVEVIKRAMVGVTKEGTSARIFGRAGYESAGKTGTSQVIGMKQNEKYVASRIAEKHRDHALYIAFAPVDKPTIAIALIVENGGFGATSAAPIAKKALDYHLLGKRPDKNERAYVPEVPAETEEEDDEDIEEDVVPAVGREEELSPVVPEESGSANGRKKNNSGNNGLAQ
ncbi:penicillin-binding protein 2 [Oxalobacter vibrioformis]|uniref:Peptidoglycan D,D-transpeptidase MrdA n=1 Tax=Oxalobacter vibrioformis TaxID=933080 RepID=A0A9E9LXY5_9BURK|nr:penicillin-binding protein 2 [Oxalobacter vibrioformis]WAW10742.1 penicillin-binding protein 2 [Oxalobacter vibrioformis]